MTEYRAPTREMAFTLQQVAGFSEMAKACGYEDASDDVVAAILEEDAQCSSGWLTPCGDPRGLSGSVSAIR